MKVETGPHVHAAITPNWPDIHLSRRLSREQLQLIETALHQAGRCPDCVSEIELTEAGLRIDPETTPFDVYCGGHRA